MKNNFDDILKKKWEEFQFPVDEDHRRDMIHLLDQNNRRRTGFPWWIGGLGAIVLLTAFSLFIIPGEKQNDQVAPDKSSIETEIMQDKAEVIEKTNDAGRDKPNANNDTSIDEPKVINDASTSTNDLNGN